MSHRVHILGASGSGTTTLGAALGRSLSCPHFDADNYYWQPTDPPFREARPRPERQQLLITDLNGEPAWVLSGSLCGWGDVAIPLFSLAVFLWIPQELRMSRLLQRERQRYGEQALSPDGRMHKHSMEFLECACQYDDAGPEMRSRRLHEQWLANLPCKVLRLEGGLDVADRVQAVREALQV